MTGISPFYSILSAISVVVLCIFLTLLIDLLISQIIRYFKRINSKFKLLLSYAFKSKTDFILQISKKRKCIFKEKKQPHYPPPGYGIPPEKLHTFKKQHKLETEDLPDNYHMILIPEGLGMWFFGMTIILSAIATLPLVSLYNSDALSKLGLFFCIIGVITLVSIAFHKVIYSHMQRSVLSDIWAIWPEPCNHMLCSVPHRVRLSKSDIKIKKLQKYPIYWNPKPETPLYRQPQQYAPKIPTLQGVLLNFAIFDFFFYKKPKLSDHSNILNVRRWATYWMAPVWVSYLVLILFMVIYFWISKTWETNIAEYLTSPSPSSSLTSEFFQNLLTKIQSDLKGGASPLDKNSFWLKGGSFVIALILWMIATAIFIHMRLAKMIKLKDKVASGYFKSYENLVPQQILRRLTEIPEEQQIAHIIDQQRIFFHFLLFGAFVNFLLILDALK